MKTKEELNAIKEEVEVLNKKLAELNEDELKQVTGGWLDQAEAVGGFISPKLPGTSAVNPSDFEFEQTPKDSYENIILGTHHTCPIDTLG